MLWNGAADTAIDLHTLLPPGYVSSWALSVDASENVFGGGLDAHDHYHAVEWTIRGSLPGDANLDGTVDFSDLLLLTQHYGSAGGWVQGDFNQDGAVGFDDLLALAQDYGQPLASQSRPAAALPEPVAAALIAIGTVGFLRRTKA